MVLMGDSVSFFERLITRRKRFKYVLIIFRIDEPECTDFTSTYFWGNLVSPVMNFLLMEELHLITNQFLKIGNIINSNHIIQSIIFLLYRRIVRIRIFERSWREAI